METAAARTGNLRAMFRLDLRKLILLLALVSALLTFGNSFLASYQTQRSQLMEQTLASNRAYATKLAKMTQRLFVSMQAQLAFSADVLGTGLDDAPRVYAEVRRLATQTDSFNSVLVVDAQGIVRAASTNVGYYEGQRLSTVGARQALAEHRPLVSSPYTGANGELLVFISHPIHDAEQNYLGFIGGGIFLRRPNILHDLLGQHFHQDGSYIYVVDNRGQLIYHRDAQRVGEQITGNPAIEATIRDEEGAQRITNSLGIDMLAGYSHVPASDWGVVAQRPTRDTLRELDDLAWKALRNAIPLTLPSLLLFWWLAGLISLPLRELAQSARAMDDKDTPERIGRIRDWYYEARRLKQALLAGVTLMHLKMGRLNQENLTDPLTGLTNRRGMQLALDDWQRARQAFSVLAIDIDHFKRVNDRYGHDVGDQVLQFLARKIGERSRSSDLNCRSGGEEFIMLLPDTPEDAARMVAQRLCNQVALALSPTGEPITLSIGVAHYPSHGTTVAEVLKRADLALYAAKRGGRNQVRSAGEALPADLPEQPEQPA